MTSILGISGSLRQGSFNTILLRAAERLMPEGATLTTRTLHGIPLYDGDLEATNFPPEVTALKEAIATADGVILCTPDYNNSVPGVFKNAIDWCSCPLSDVPRVFGDRPFAVIGASPSGFGTILGQSAWLPILRALGAQHWSGGRLVVSRVGAAFDADGNLTAPVMNELTTFLEGFVAYVRKNR